MRTINEPTRTPGERVAALQDYLAGKPQFPDFVTESNNHVHTVYSFSPYTPAMAALKAREAGLMVVGSVDHDSAAAAGELTAAAALLGMGSVTGFECRVYLYSTEEVEQGTAPLFGSTEREQARALIEEAAHPRVRDELWEEAVALGLA